MYKKDIYRFFNLHKLIIMVLETAGNEIPDRGQGNGEGKQALFPVVQVIADNRFYVVFVDGRTVFHKSREIMSAFFLPPDYFNLVRQRHLGIRNNESWHECMRFVADTASDAADAYADNTVRDFKGANITGMDRKTGGVSTGACELVDLEPADEVIINILDIFSIGIAIESG